MADNRDQTEVPDWMIDASNLPPATALQTLAAELPHGWSVQLDIQRGSGGVTLFGPFDDMYEPETGGGIEADMLEALRFARFRETEADKSVEKAWARFQAEMRRTGEPIQAAIPEQAGAQVPSGWRLDRNPGFGAPIAILAPNGYGAHVTKLGRNPENVLYMLAEALLATPPTKDPQ